MKKLRFNIYNTAKITLLLQKMLFLRFIRGFFLQFRDDFVIEAILYRNLNVILSFKIIEKYLLFERVLLWMGLLAFPHSVIGIIKLVGVVFELYQIIH